MSDLDTRLEAHPKVDDLWHLCWINFQRVKGSMEDILRAFHHAEDGNWGFKKMFEAAFVGYPFNEELRKVHLEIENANLNDEEYALLKEGVIEVANRLRAIDLLAAHAYILPTSEHFAKICVTFSAYYVESLVEWIASEFVENHVECDEIKLEAEQWVREVKAVIAKDDRLRFWRAQNSVS